MVERGHVFRRAFSWLPAQFASQSDAPVGAPRQFGSTEHLSTEAVAAFVDGELRMNAHLRAAHHISLCAGLRRRSGRSAPGSRRAARLPSDQNPQHAAGIAVADSALPARRRRRYSTKRSVGVAPHAGKRGPTSRRWHLHPVVGGSRAIGAVRSTRRRQHTRSPRASVGWTPVWPSRCAAPCSSP